MKLTKSKQFLADAIHASGKGWPAGADWACQSKTTYHVYFATGSVKPTRSGFGYKVHKGETFLHDDTVEHDKLLPNWHQTVISRGEYFSAYPAEPVAVLKQWPAADADGWINWSGGERPVSADMTVSIRVRGESGSARGKASHWHWGHSGCGSDIIAYRLCEQPEQRCESVTRSIPEPESKPTIEQLAADYRNAKDYANRKQQEADDAKAAADEALGELERAGEALGLLISVAKPEPEPELVITDWRDLRVGDVIWIGDSGHHNNSPEGEYDIVDIDGRDEDQPVGVFWSGRVQWPQIGKRGWRFIRRP